MSLGENKPQTLKNLLSELINSKGWKEKLEEQKLPLIWKSVVGANIAAVSNVIKFEDGILYVSTNSSTWRSEIRLREVEIIDSINKSLGKDLIKQLKVK